MNITLLKKSIKSSLKDVPEVLKKTSDQATKYGKILAPGMAVSAVADAAFGPDIEQIKTDASLKTKKAIVKDINKKLFDKEDEKELLKKEISLLKNQKELEDKKKN